MSAAILVVDDNPDNMKLVRWTLACIAHRAGVRGRGEGGLVEFLAGGVDLGLP